MPIKYKLKDVADFKYVAPAEDREMAEHVITVPDAPVDASEIKVITITAKSHAHPGNVRVKLFRSHVDQASLMVPVSSRDIVISHIIDVLEKNRWLTCGQVKQSVQATPTLLTGPSEAVASKPEKKKSIKHAAAALPVPMPKKRIKVKRDDSKVRAKKSPVGDDAKIIALESIYAQETGYWAYRIESKEPSKKAVGKTKTRYFVKNIKPALDARFKQVINHCVEHGLTKGQLKALWQQHVVDSIKVKLGARVRMIGAKDKPKHPVLEIYTRNGVGNVGKSRSLKFEVSEAEKDAVLTKAKAQLAKYPLEDIDQAMDRLKASLGLTYWPKIYPDSGRSSWLMQFVQRVKKQLVINESISFKQEKIAIKFRSFVAHLRKEPANAAILTEKQHQVMAKPLVFFRKINPIGKQSQLTYRGAIAQLMGQKKKSISKKYMPRKGSQHSSLKIALAVVCFAEVNEVAIRYFLARDKNNFDHMTKAILPTATKRREKMLALIELGIQWGPEYFNRYHSSAIAAKIWFDFCTNSLDWLEAELAKVAADVNAGKISRQSGCELIKRQKAAIMAFAETEIKRLDPNHLFAPRKAWGHKQQHIMKQIRKQSRQLYRQYLGQSKQNITVVLKWDVEPGLTEAQKVTRLITQLDQTILKVKTSNPFATIDVLSSENLLQSAVTDFPALLAQLNDLIARHEGVTLALPFSLANKVDDLRTAFAHVKAAYKSRELQELNVDNKLAFDASRRNMETAFAGDASKPLYECSQQFVFLQNHQGVVQQKIICKPTPFVDDTMSGAAMYRECADAPEGTRSYFHPNPTGTQISSLVKMASGVNYVGALCLAEKLDVPEKTAFNHMSAEEIANTRHFTAADGLSKAQAKSTARGSCQYAVFVDGKDGSRISAGGEKAKIEGGAIEVTLGQDVVKYRELCVHNDDKSGPEYIFSKDLPVADIKWFTGAAEIAEDDSYLSVSDEEPEALSDDDFDSEGYGSGSEADDDATKVSLKRAKAPMAGAGAEPPSAKRVRCHEPKQSAHVFYETAGAGAGVKAPSPSI